MLKYFMDKIIFFLILQTFLLTNILAQEPSLATLKNVHSNTLQKFIKGEYSFYCLPYGVLTIEDLYQNGSINMQCKKQLQLFYKQNPLDEYFASKLLKVEQKYHVDFREQRCIVYASGEKTLSELLLENGLAVVKPLFQDDEFLYSYNRAQLGARVAKKGVWNYSALVTCINALNKKQ